MFRIHPLIAVLAISCTTFASPLLGTGSGGGALMRRSTPSRTTIYSTSTLSPGYYVTTTTSCSSVCPPVDNSGNALIETSNCGTNCLFCRWNWPGGNHFAEYYVDTGLVFSPVGVAANPAVASVACTTSTSTTTPTPTRTTIYATSTATSGTIITTTETCGSVCPQLDTSGNALIESSNCGDNCLFCRWNWPGGNHFAEYYVDTGAIFSPIGVAANPVVADVACSNTTKTATITPSRTTALATSTASSGDIITTTTTCSSVCPAVDNSGNALIESSSCGTNCIFCRWNWPGGNHFAQYYVDTGAVFNPVGVAANPNFADVSCTTAAVTSTPPPTSTITTTTSSTSTPSTTTPTATLPSGWSTAFPCATDTSSRLISNPYSTTLSDNTPYACATFCAARGFILAGVEYSNECYCGTGYSVDPSTIDNAPASECSMACAGDDTLTCGGSWRMQIYSTGLSPAAGEAPSGWSSYGCVRDTSDRVLASPKYAGADLSDTNSPAACTSYCADLNYTMAGVEYGSECYCSSSWASDTAPSLIDSSECDYACSGAPALTCGGSWALQVYSAS